MDLSDSSDWCFFFIFISQDSIATRIACTGIFRVCQWKNSKIGWYLTYIWTKVRWHVLWHAICTKRVRLYNYCMRIQCTSRITINRSSKCTRHGGAFPMLSLRSSFGSVIATKEITNFASSIRLLPGIHPAVCCTSRCCYRLSSSIRSPGSLI